MEIKTIKLYPRYADIRIRGKRIFAKAGEGKRYVYALPDRFQFPEDTGTRNLIRRNFRAAVLLASHIDQAEFLINGYLGVNDGRLTLETKDQGSHARE